MSISISEGQARLIYLDYHTRGNTMGTSAQEMGAIVSQYADKIHTWQASVDDNQYEWDDSDYDQYIDDGWKKGEEATGGHTRKDQAGDVAASTGHLIGAVGGAAATVAKEGIIEAGKNVGNIISKVTGKKVAEEGSKKIAEEAGKKAAETATKQTAEKLPFSAYIGAILSIATYAAYLIKKPNKEGAKACETMQNTLQNTQGALQGSQADMQNMQSELIQLSDEASAKNDATNQDIEDKKTEQEYYLSVYNSLKAKIASGKELTDGEKNLYKLCAKNINASGENINDLVEENQDEITDIYDSMGTYQEEYDYAAETMGEAQGITEYTASFDKQTRSFAYVEGAAQILNAANGAISGARLMVGPWWQWIVGIASIAAGVGSGFAAKEQFSIAKTAGATIEQREITEELNTTTHEVYDVEIDNYAALMGATEELEVAVPDSNPTVDAGVPSSQAKKEEPKKPKVEEPEGGK